MSVAQRAKLYWLMHLLNWVPDNVRLLSEFAEVKLSSVITACSTRAQATVKTLFVIVTVSGTLQMATWSPVCKPDCAVTDPSCNTELSWSSLTSSFTYIPICTYIKRTGQEAWNGRHPPLGCGCGKRWKKKRKRFLVRVTFPRCVAHVHHHCSLRLCARLRYFSCEDSGDSVAHSAAVLTNHKKERVWPAFRQSLFTWVFVFMENMWTLWTACTEEFHLLEIFLCFSILNKKLLEIHRKAWQISAWKIILWNYS